MNNKIEKMNRMRKNIFCELFIGAVISFIVLYLQAILNNIYIKLRLYKFYWLNRAKAESVFFKMGLLLFLLTLLIFGIRYLFYKWRLFKDPVLRAAVDDERVRMNWLKAFRFAFIVIIGITIFWKWHETSLFPQKLYTLFPQGALLIPFASIIALTGYFLYHNREKKIKVKLREKNG